MTFNEGASIDPGRVSMGGGGGPGMGGKLAMGGGAGGLIILVLTLLLGGDPGSVLGGGSGVGQSQIQQDPAAGAEQCATSEDANTKVDCRVRLTVQSLDLVWGTELQKQANVAYVEPKVMLFSGSVNTGCGNATSDVGPFYCPTDQTAYFDTSFFQLLVDKFGSSGGPLAQEYVVAHEIGHHIQNQLGNIGRAQSDPEGQDSASVRTELQADCYAGIWASYADKIPTQNGQPFLKKLSDSDIRDALSAASSVGDDRIQKSATGSTNPETWTHGSSEERQKWFLAGYQSGQLNNCDTFSSRDLSNPN